MSAKGVRRHKKRLFPKYLEKVARPVAPSDGRSVYGSAAAAASAVLLRPGPLRS
jgi:hypothetical protein